MHIYTTTYHLIFSFYYSINENFALKLNLAAIVNAKTKL